MLYEIVKKAGDNLPEPVKRVLSALGLGRLIQFICGKYKVELAFQKEWAEEFIHNKDKVLDYWKKYRYLDDIEKICKFDNDKRILDVGCGICTVLHYVKGEKYGIDPLADEYLKIYKYPDDLNILKGRGEEIPFPDGHFDVIFCSNVLDHVSDPEKTIDDISRVLKQDGYFVFTVEIFSEKTERDPAHPHSLLKKDIIALLKGTFEIILEKESSWIGIKNYVEGVLEERNKELILVLKKI